MYSRVPKRTLLTSYHPDSMKNQAGERHCLSFHIFSFALRRILCVETRDQHCHLAYYISFRSRKMDVSRRWPLNGALNRRHSSAIPEVNSGRTIDIHLPFPATLLVSTLSRRSGKGEIVCEMERECFHPLERKVD